MLGYIINDPADRPIFTSVEVIIEFLIGKGWVLATSELFASELFAVR